MRNLLKILTTCATIIFCINAFAGSAKPVFNVILDDPNNYTNTGISMLGWPAITVSGKFDETQGEAVFNSSYPEARYNSQGLNKGMNNRELLTLKKIGVKITIDSIFFTAPGYGIGQRHIVPCFIKGLNYQLQSDEVINLKIKVRKVHDVTRDIISCRITRF